MQGRGRDAGIDFARGIGILAITYGHVFQVLYGSVDIVCKYLFSFELAVFFLASGYVQQGRRVRGPGEYIRHSARTLLYPYLTFSLLLFLFESLLSILQGSLAGYLSELPVRLATALTWGEGTAWFFPTFFLAGFLVCLCRKKSRIPETVWMAASIILGACLCVIAEKYGDLREATSASIITPGFWLWHLLSLTARSVAGMSLMLIGAELKKHMPEKMNGGGYAFAVLLLGVGAAAALFNDGFVDLHFAFIRNPFLFYIGAVCTTTGLLLIGHGFHPRGIQWCGKESLLLMLAQSGLVYASQAVSKLHSFEGKPYAAGAAVVVMLVGLPVCYAVIRLIHGSFLRIIIEPPRGRKKI